MHRDASRVVFFEGLGFGVWGSGFRFFFLRVWGLGVVRRLKDCAKLRVAFFEVWSWSFCYTLKHDTQIETAFQVLWCGCSEAKVGSALGSRHVS